MKVILSPSKTQDFEDYKLPTGVASSTPVFSKEIKTLIKKLKSLKPDEISKLMSLSDNLTDLNFQRYQDFDPLKFTKENAKPSLLAFQGDVYRDILSEEYNKEDWKFAEENIRIISGLYGLLHPLDLIQPYRLEMKTSLQTNQAKDLYEFWGKKLHKLLSSEMSKDEKIINLASNEYSKALLPHFDKDQIIDISFKEKKGATYKVIAIYSKYARGNMAHQIIKNKINKPKDLKSLNINGYKLDKRMSSDNEYVFSRSQ